MSITLFAGPLLMRLYGTDKVNAGVFFTSRLLIWLVFILLLLWVKFGEKEKLLIWPESKRSVAFYLLSVLAVLGILLFGNLIIVLVLKLFSHAEQSAKFLEYIAVLKTNTPLLIFTLITAGITEELIFRGYLQTRISVALKSPVAGMIISSALFALAHISYGTFLQVVAPFYIGMVFSFFYWKYKNIKVLIICHCIWDAMAIILTIASHA